MIPIAYTLTLILSTHYNIYSCMYTCIGDAWNAKGLSTFYLQVKLYILMFFSPFKCFTSLALGLHT